MSTASVPRAVPPPPRLSGAVRAAAADFFAHSWRLVAANSAWGGALLLLLASASISQIALLLVPLLALPSVGVFRVAALVAREEPVAVADGFTSWWRFGGRALAIGMPLLLCVVVLGMNLFMGLEAGDVIGWSLATFAGWGLVATAIVSVVLWPLIVDPWREHQPLRETVRIGLLLALAFPLRFGLLAALLGVLVVLSTFAVVAVLSVALAAAALIACRYVLPAADRFAPPPARPGADAA